MNRHYVYVFRDDVLEELSPADSLREAVSLGNLIARNDCHKVIVIVRVSRPCLVKLITWNKLAKEGIV